MSIGGVGCQLVGWSVNQEDGVSIGRLNYHSGK